MKLFTKAAAAVSTAVLVGSLAACGGSDRPSQEELSDALTSEDSPLGTSGLPDDVADCMAGVFVDSDLSDETLQAIVDGDDGYEGSDEDRETLTSLQEDITTECMPEMETPESPDSE